MPKQQDLETLKTRKTSNTQTSRKPSKEDKHGGSVVPASGQVAGQTSKVARSALISTPGVGTHGVTGSADLPDVELPLSSYPDLKSSQRVRECMGKDDSTQVQTNYQFGSSQSNGNSNSHGGGKDPNDNPRDSSRRFKATPGDFESNFPGQNVTSRYERSG